MKHSKKSYDSFQDELEDYIKVQKARGLEPKTCFRKMREEHLETCGYREEVDCRPRYRMSAQRLPCGAAQASPRPCSMWQTVGSQSPLCFPAQDSRLRLASLSPCQFPKACFSEKPVPVTLSQREWTCGSYGLDSRVHKHLFSGNSPSAPQAGHKQVREKRRRHPEDCRETSEEGPRRQRRRGSAEGALDPQVSVQRARATMEAEAAKLKNRKKRSQDVASKKEGRRRKRVKKEQGKERTEEEMLWDQSILGF